MKDVVLLTGVPGAWTHRVSQYLQQTHAFQACWPGQDLTVWDADRQLRSNWQNVEVTRIHEALLDNAGQTWLTAASPRYYDVPTPGPADLLGMFPDGSRIVVVDFLLCLFLPLWSQYAAGTIVVDCDVEESEHKITVWAGSELDQTLVQRVATHYRNRLQQAMDAYAGYTLQLSTQDVRAGVNFERIDQFVETVCCTG